MTGFVKVGFHPLAGTRGGPPAAPRAARRPRLASTATDRVEPPSDAVRVVFDAPKPTAAPRKRRKPKK